MTYTKIQTGGCATLLTGGLLNLNLTLCSNTVDGRNLVNQLIWGKYPIIYIVSIQISGGLLALGFLSEPSTVSDF